jgi:hypothetical protein
MIDAASICALIVSKIDGGEIYTYGSHPGDAILVPPPTRTMILVVDCDWPRWFDITVRETSPERDPTGLFFDPEIMAVLTRRAAGTGRPPRSFE